MKTTTLYLLIVAALAGCAQQTKPDPKLAELEQRLQELEADCVHQRTNSEAVLEGITKLTARAMSEFTNLFSDLHGAIEADVKNEVALEISRQIEALKIEAPQRAAAARAPAPARTALKNGVPVSIYDQIAAEAARDWPGDFKMQKFVIDSQIEAYLKLQAAR